MKDVSLKNVNLVNGFDVGRCVDMVFIDILDGVCVHGIDDGVPFQNTFSIDGWFHSLFGFLEYIMSNNGCALIWCDALWHDYKKSWWHWHVEAMSIVTQNFMLTT
jgi:hypothetical protein